MPSQTIKRIRLLDKGLRDEFKHLALFQVTFGRLRDHNLETVEKVEVWYKDLLVGENYRKLKSLWRENSESYWKNAQQHHDNLPEYQSLKYLRQIFVAECKKTMPEVIIKLKRKPHFCHLCGVVYPRAEDGVKTCKECRDDIRTDS